jgi:hypothetical protein
MGTGNRRPTCRKAAALHDGDRPSQSDPITKGGINAMAKKTGGKKKGGKKR